MSYTTMILEQTIQKNPNEPEFHQAMTEILPTLQPFLDEHPEYEKAGILERLVEPERQIMFRVPWIDDAGAFGSTEATGFNSTAPSARIRVVCAFIRA